MIFARLSRQLRTAGDKHQKGGDRSLRRDVITTGVLRPSQDGIATPLLALSHDL